MARLLGYLCDKYFAGEADQIKEYNIAVDLLGRSLTFDPAEDAIARVEVHRLRKKLKEFYEGEGSRRAVRIVIPTGCYVPSFVPVAESVTPATVEATTTAVVETSTAIQTAALPATIIEPVLPPGFRVSRSLVMALVAVGVLVAAGLAAFRRSPSPAPDATPGVAARLISRPDPGGAVQGEAVRFLAGRSNGYTDVAGRVWGPDRYFTGGDVYKAPDRYIARTSDPTLYLGGREGHFSYDIPLEPGNYELRLHFAETRFGPGNPEGGGDGSRVFHVINAGKRILGDFDVLSDAQGPNVADVRVFKDVAPEDDGFLHLRFLKASGDKPMISAIELVPMRPHRMNPIRISVQARPYRDRQGNWWSADEYWLGGQTAEHSSPVRGAADPAVLTMERYGNFNYAIPLADGTYSLTLYFAETYWGPENPGGGGPGTRVFDIFANGVALQRGLDVFGRVGANKVLSVQFDNLTPNSQGKLLVSFTPVRNYATLCALEVEDVSPR